MTRKALFRLPKSRPSQRRTTRPLVEPLESRRLLAVVSSWKGDGDALDSAGANHGTMQSGATFGPGQLGQAFDFDGIDDQFTAPTTGLPTGNASRTIALWTNIDAQNTNEAFFASYGTPGTQGGVFALGRQSDLVFVTQWGQAVSGGNVDPSTWHHIAATLESGNLFRLYVDGVQVSSGTMSISTPAGSTFYLGQQQAPYGDTRKLDGRVDEVTVHDGALSASEIQALFVAGGGAAPVAADDAYSVRVDTALEIPAHGVLVNDSGQRAVLDSGPLHGTLTLNADGGFLYTPTAGYTGPDSFTYHSVNGAGSSNTATVAITVNPSFLDPTWDGDGTAQINLSQSDGARTLVIQPDGKVIVGGWYTPKSGNDDFALIRRNIDGSLDASFGTGGIVKTSFGNKSDVIVAAALQSNGKIVVGGWSTSGSSLVFALARYNANGTLDTSFGSGGKVTTNIGSGDEVIHDVAIQADGRIVAIGSASIGGGGAIARYHANGTLDTSFGSGGKLTAGWLRGGSSHRVLVQPDGKLLVSASHGGGGVARLNANGTLDSSFAGGSVVNVLANTYGLAMQGEKIVVSGQAAPSIDDAIARLNADGTLDTSFASGGLAPVVIDIPIDVAVQTDGKIVIGGQQVNAGDEHGLLAMRFNADGSLDTAFGTNGLVSAPNPSVVATRVRLAPDGKIVVTGYGDFFTARFLGELPAGSAAASADGVSPTEADVALMLFLADGNANRRKRA
jgi:uncharacterized delta-60 repeat protein